MRARQPLKAALAKVPLMTVHGPWSRAVEFRYLHLRRPNPLWGGASKINGARFTPKDGFDCIYLAWLPVTALAEVQALVLLQGGMFQPVTPPWVLMSVTGVVSGILDLTENTTLQALGTNEQEITGAWVLSEEPPTQLLAQMAYESGRIVGVKYPSAKHLGGGNNRAVFPDRLFVSATNFLEVHDPQGHLALRLGA